jgi:uncharacterized protein (TIGR02452 family)
MRAFGAFASIITKKEFYEFNKLDRVHDSDFIIYSPNVPFFRNSQNEFLEEPFNISIIPSPAIFARRSTSSKEMMYQIMGKRCRKIIQCAIHQNDKIIALGAFGNGSNMTAEIFKKILKDEGYQFYFDYIVFPIPEFHRANRSWNIDRFATILDTPIRRIQ